MTKLYSSFVFFTIVSLMHSVRSNPIQPALITVTGTGEAKAKPDQVSVTVGIQLNDKTVQVVGKKVDSTSSAVIAYLSNNGVADKDIMTSYVTLTPYYSFQNGASQVTPQYYTAQKSITFTLKDIKNYDHIMEGLYGAGINSVSNVNFMLASTSAYQQQARQKAVNDAKTIANLLITNLGAKLGGVYSVSESTDGQDTTVPVYYNAREVASNAASSTVQNTGPSVAGGEVTVSSTVHVSYYIQN